ncbi:hypothetical protein CROQUDRAFT_720288 [Cronartium quercuum f. sp. fusiforme G11]|uniref:Uncharacterized protein n=1 Tax=Cronartium quercuum f. sp. fusiforme G11 TaxID=708437 RepID=A0A9P6TGK4_9BASI|nr:hypothetical protein CROQUDRAFT_720288 [Cronartium quercuum f. sp. fusiforme G11]
MLPNFVTIFPRWDPSSTLSSSPDLDLKIDSSELQKKAQRDLAVSTITLGVPITASWTGFILLQFIRFLASSKSKGQRYARIWGSVGMFLHILQLSIQIENVRFSFMRYVLTEPVNFFLYEGIETLATVGIVLIVQLKSHLYIHRFHFSRITHAISANKSWLRFSIASFLITCLGGFSTVVLSILKITNGGFEKDTPSKFSHNLTTAWIIWLTSATAFDLTLTAVLVRKLIECRSWITQKSIRNCLGRLMALAIQTFFLTSLTSCLSMMLIAIAGFTSITNPSILAKLELAAFVNNALLPRIYLISFC